MARKMDVKDSLMARQSVDQTAPSSSTAEGTGFFSRWRAVSTTCRARPSRTGPTSDDTPRVSGTKWPLSVSPRLSTSCGLVVFLIQTLLASSPVAAVQIRPTNCLNENFILQNPPYLQWVPIGADAKFNSTSDKHNFRFEVWGNVTGSLDKQKLPAPDSQDWSDPEKKNGKIIDSENSVNGTTVKSSISLLSYVPWSHLNYFCREALVNGSCPLPPTFNTTGNVSLHDLPSLVIDADMNSSYSFTSFAATMLIIFGNSEGTNIGCMSAVIAPDLGNLAWVLRIVPLIVLLFAGFAVVFASIFSPWGSSNIFRWTSNYGRDADLLRLVTPGFGDCLQYIQFIALSGALSLSYPGFFQPVASQVAWSALMFNESFVTHSPGWHSVQDGIYVTDTPDGYGLHTLGRLVGMRESADIWAGMMVWLCVILVIVSVLAQAGFLAQWLYRKIENIPEEDLRAKNLPFTVGNVIRIVFNFLLVPIVALSCFQLVAASESPNSVIALAAITLGVLFLFASYVLLLIIRTRPKSCLFDDLPTVLRYGPLYNTYSDEAAAFALIPFLLNFVRGISIGAVQASGISQVVLLAICEVIQIFTLHAFRPFHSPTSMNAYHTLFAVLRLACLLLMVAFAPSLGVTEGPKGWIGYAILLIHGGVLALGFFLGALQTIVEVAARLLGAGRDDLTGLTRGGLSKIFGMRQLSRRETHRAAPSRASQLSSMAMLHAEEGARAGSSMHSGRIRSASGASYGGIAARRKHRSSSGLDSIDNFSAGHRHVDTNSSYMPGTPGETSTFSFVASPTVGRSTAPAHMEPSDPYYRPPRRTANINVRDSLRSETPLNNALGIEARPNKAATAASAAAAAAAAASVVAGGPAPAGEATTDHMGIEEIPRGTTPAPTGGIGAMTLPAHRPDYATREVDFYYGVRGPALNSDNPGRRLGTGPADPTGPVATATGWFRNLFGGKNKEKGKKFEVVRSSRMPPHMVRNGGFGDETPPEGIPVAMGVLRNGPIDSDSDDDDDDDASLAKRSSKPVQRRPDGLLTVEGDPQDSDADASVSPIESVSSIGAQTANLPRGRQVRGGQDDMLVFDLPELPRRSSKRHSDVVDPQEDQQAHAPHAVRSASPESPVRVSGDVGSSHQGLGEDLSTTSVSPIERTSSQMSSMEFPGEPEAELRVDGQRDERAANYGTVSHREISRADMLQLPPLDLGSSAELVDDFVDVKRPR